MPEPDRQWPIRPRSSMSAPPPSGNCRSRPLLEGSISTAPTCSEEIEENDFIELPMTARHSLAATTLPHHHDDPFDRMLIAQAKLEGLTIITRDPAFRTYGVSSPPDLKRESVLSLRRQAKNEPGVNPGTIGWTCRGGAHIANAEILPRIAVICEPSGLALPYICTPEELLGSSQ